MDGVMEDLTRFILVERTNADDGGYWCRKYQFMELNTQRRAAGLKDKIPEMLKTLDTVRFLKSRTVRIFPLSPHTS